MLRALGFRPHHPPQPGSLEKQIARWRQQSDIRMGLGPRVLCRENSLRFPRNTQVQRAMIPLEVAIMIPATHFPTSLLDLLKQWPRYEGFSGTARISEMVM